MSEPRIPGYTYVERIGGGGFADVFLYEQDWPRQRVAVKVVRPDVALTEREKALFTAEANAMARLADHPYIVSVITAGITDEGRPYLVMRYCPPPDLGVRVRTSPMGVAEAVSTGIKLASAIETAHRSGILHRDIKPSNVLVTTYQEPALTDFGIAGHMVDLANEQEVRLSYPWAAPELVAGQSNGTVASDVYSLGATIWNLMVGRSPFSIPQGDNSSHALTSRILHSPAPLTRRPDVPPALDRLLQQCLAKQPEHRPQSALELARALQRIESQAGYARTAIAVEGDRPTVTAPEASDDVTHVRAATVQPQAPQQPQAPSPAGRPGPGPGEETTAPPRRSALTAALVAAAAVLAAVVVFALTRGDDEGDPGVVLPDDPSRTPISLAPEAPAHPPVVTGRRTGAAVSFAWRGPDRPQDGDSWEWRRPDTGESRRTTDRALVLRGTDGRTCLQVRMIRGSFASPWTEKCVA
jgi:hypothetical protein